jgi:hypothetical protein
MIPDEQRCKGATFKRDTYRYTGRGKGGFEMHYIQGECTRRANASGYCWQHQPMYAPTYGDKKGEATNDPAPDKD